MHEILEGEAIDRSIKTRGVYVMEASGVPGLKIGALGSNSDKSRRLSTRIREIKGGCDKEFQVLAFLDLRDESQAMVRAVEALVHLALDGSHRNVKVHVKGKEKILREQFEVDIEVAKRAIVKARETAGSHVGKDA